ncbi:hypothetical protein [Longitalea arenae]|uniref:hypothetical protein n=1 Tax=Longitalea arenae TaxID=2812558 RepID=UPI0019676367|nr:hypothetical protein [Longitalea arenae]
MPAGIYGVPSHFAQISWIRTAGRLQKRKISIISLQALNKRHGLAATEGVFDAVNMYRNGSMLNG